MGESIVNFQISSVDGGPDAPVIYAAPGEISEAHVWARPAAAYNLSAYSLNMVLAQLGVLQFDNVSVLNSVVDGGGTLRHQLIFDSATGLLVDGAGVRGFIGFSVFPAEDALPLGAGSGPACNGDLDCGTASGHPSWHIATLALHVDSWGTTARFLESGTQGVWQSPAIAMAPDPPTEASAVFGVPNEVVHSWGDNPGPEMRNARLGEADAVVVVASADFDENGTVDSAGFLTWQRGLGLGDTLADGDTDGNAVVNVSHLAAWRFQFGTTPSMKGSSMVVPEPHPALALLAGIVPWDAGGRSHEDESATRRFGVDDQARGSYSPPDAAPRSKL